MFLPVRACSSVINIGKGDIQLFSDGIYEGKSAVIVSYRAAQEKPTAAFVLSLIGGIFGVIAGVILWLIVVVVLGVNVYFGYPYASFPDFVILYGSVGLWLLVSGIIVVMAAGGLNSDPGKHTMWGVVILIFSILGGAVFWLVEDVVIFDFLILGGAIFGLAGGILALVWKPRLPSTPPPPP